RSQGPGAHAPQRTTSLSVADSGAESTETAWTATLEYGCRLGLHASLPVAGAVLGPSCTKTERSISSLPVGGGGTGIPAGSVLSATNAQFVLPALTVDSSVRLLAASRNASGGSTCRPSVPPRLDQSRTSTQ